MRILVIDVGTGTQDILLFDSSTSIENCVKLIAPSPTVVIANRIRRATSSRRNIFLSGVTMGGGPSGWAMEDHLRAGLAVYATPDAARTFNDDLEEVKAKGVRIVSGTSELPAEAKVRQIEMKDVDLPVLARAFHTLSASSHYDAIAIAVQDHGNAPPGISDRIFRFDYLKRVIAENNRLDSFAYLADQIPPYLTRMLAVAGTIGDSLPLLVMDTGPAATLGALEDRQVAEHANRVIVNVGNFHTLAFHLLGNRIIGFFEHHTGKLTGDKLDRLIKRLSSGELTNGEVFDDHGHGAFVLEKGHPHPFVAVTGPRRAMMNDSDLKPYFAVPHGDMMLAGCFGLVRAFSEKIPEWKDEISWVLAGAPLPAGSTPD